ncbi:hypothetical protein [uncultured Phenylobacterium sp.]|uniref:hypothetical protein n=1 Tax=uncultured Phenylobacterium sp. TaxID=349273 RepID=UPI002600A433|nr:hypothetical protein [uncultured Phenylobacterium sp.]
MLTQAVLRAVMDARWRCEDLISRKSISAAPDLLRGNAGELAFSGAARDQLLGLALLAAARDVERPGVVSEMDTASLLAELRCEPIERLAVRSAALESAPAASGGPAHIAAAIEDRLRAERRSPTALAEALRGEARLQELLWDNPCLPCSDGARLLMLFAAPKLLERAADLRTGRAAAMKAAPARAARADRPARIHRPWLGLLPEGWLLVASAALAAAATGLLAEG